MKYLLLPIILFFLSVATYAAPVNNVIFFGDSLSDNGNLYEAVLHVIPKSPPYYRGRFSNGPTWAEYVGDYFYQHNFASYENYAYGGATAIMHAPTSKFVAPTILPNEIDYYLFDHLMQDKSNTLFSIWIGGNDYIFANPKQDQAKLTDNVIASIEASINNLHRYGARHFMILNLPDLGKIPYAILNKLENQLSQLTALHNAKLATLIKTLQTRYPESDFAHINFYDLFNDVLVDIEKYNKKFNLHITNTSEACWQGGFFLKQNIDVNLLQKEIRAAAYTTNKAWHRNGEQAISHLLSQNPLLRATYLSGNMYEQGAKPCSNPNEYIFWDNIHPSAVTHQVVAGLVEQQLAQTNFVQQQ